ncbi:gamma-glutamylcyclotransferase [Zobellia sp. KMM 6746]|uniref:Gamma-glutamylcyclotransferase n=2 Tax=Zobellia barbeyronii TaxID=2748009 RepID=A0ABS5W963_9FLAO|nr:gamma-glutamylcyclotransferase [Zobellia barbeyronii]MBT2159963.1 gamma-glutamylcyclotransferase [Zobellia barbeyronii]
MVGIQDVLNGYYISLEKIMGRYLVIEKAINKESKIEGIVYELQDNEFLKVDLYEGEAYKKIKVVLKSGKSAWVYVKA